MAEIFIQVLEAALSASVVIGLVLGVCLRWRLAREEKRVLAVAGVVGSAAALIISVLRRTTAWINLTFYSTLGMIAALVCGLLFMAGFRRKGYRFSLVTGALVIAAVLFYTLPRVFLMPAGFLNLEESAASTDFLFKCGAYLAGMIFVIVIVYVTAKMAVLHGTGAANRLVSQPAVTGSDGKGTGVSVTVWLKPALDLVKAGCAVALVIEFLNDAVQILQFLFARRIIPIHRQMFTLVAFLRNNSSLFIFAEVAVLVIVAAAVFILALHEKPSAGNPAERRKARALFRGNGRRFALITALACFSVFSLTALKVWSARTVTLSPPEPYLLEDGVISINLDAVSDGRLHRFAWTASEGVEVRFIVLKKNESSFGVGLDACDICGATGYYQRGDDVICMLCDVVMNKNTIGFKGGCNPVPLAYTISGGAMTVQCEDLDNERGRFK
jgi:uncharacterized membrane protein